MVKAYQSGRQAYRIRRRRQRQFRRRLRLFCLAAFLAGFLSGRTMVKSFFDEAGKSSSAQAAAGWQVEETEGSREKQSDHITGRDSDWNMVLVNRENPLPSDFTVSLSPVGDGHQVDRRAAPALLEMLEDGRAAGYEIVIVSSYRTMKKQTQLYDQKVEKLISQGYSQKEAEKEAGKIVAIPGTSEHQLGLAVDLASANYTTLDQRQEQTPSYRWLMEHCQEYGFILRYPNDKTEITGIVYEPWHFRYVGKEAAAEIMERKICLEEYLDAD